MRAVSLFGDVCRKADVSPIVSVYPNNEEV
jgi:hypothetical protein